MRRHFNVAGPCRPDWHYMIPAERRLPQAPELIEQRGYFVVHAPRQTGKTTALSALAQQLTASGRYAALLFSCEEGGVAGDNYGAAQRALLRQLVRSAAANLPPELRPPPFSFEGEEGLVGDALAAWVRACPRPLVLIFDEIDALRGQSLISVLRQLRAGYFDRPRGFPSSVILCGLRDVRDYKAASGGDPDRLGTSSPFNIKLESLRVGNFSQEELRELYAQHTADTGQVFTEDALVRAFQMAGGQPWLVNARGRIDLLVRFPYRKPDGSRAVQRRALELKVWRRGQKSPLAAGLAQLDEYLARLRLSRGTLVLFDARGRLARRDPRFEQRTTPAGRTATVLWA